jgi:hypothetical protein
VNEESQGGGLGPLGLSSHEKNLRCFKLRLNRKLDVKRNADKLNVGDLFLRVLKCFSCLSEGRAKERKKERKKEVDCIGFCIFSEISFGLCEPSSASFLRFR